MGRRRVGAAADVDIETDQRVAQSAEGCRGRNQVGENQSLHASSLPASARTLADDWGFPIKPADFTQRWTFRGGPTREDIFRTMTTGLNGTPMPAFGDALKPEERWAITDYMYSLGDGDAPGYATLVTAHHVDDAIDVPGRCVSRQVEDVVERFFPAVHGNMALIMK